VARRRKPRLDWDPKSTSEWVNGTSARVRYTVPFTLVHAGKYGTEDKKLKQTLQYLAKAQPRKASNTKHISKTKLPWFTRFLRRLANGHRKGGGRWAYSTTLPSPHRQEMLADKALLATLLFTISIDSFICSFCSKTTTAAEQDSKTLECAVIGPSCCQVNKLQELMTHTRWLYYALKIYLLRPAYLRDVMGNYS